MTGFREQEVMHAIYKDVDASGSTVYVRHKPQYGWSPKMYKERDVPIPSELLAELLAVKPKATGSLIFPTASGQPDTHMLRSLKRLAKRAGLDPDNFWLHKFRSTFATTVLQRGAD